MGSAALLAEARPGAAVLVRGDLLTWRPDVPVDAVLCRGVLNDLLEDSERAGALAAFAAWLRPGGVLVADVRDWGATAGRYVAAPASVERTGERDGRSVRFASETSLDRARHMLLVRERYVATAAGAPIERTAVFAMRCWSAAELRGAPPARASRPSTFATARTRARRATGSVARRPPLRLRPPRRPTAAATRPHHGSTRSTAAAAARTVASANHRATICSPTGSPPSPTPIGTEAAAGR